MINLKPIKQGLYTLIAISLVIGVFAFSSNFIRETIITSLGGYIKKENVITIDSTFVRGKVDTLEVFNHYVKTQGINLNPKPIVKYKYKYLSPDKIEVLVDSVKEFKVSVTDDLIEGTLTVYNKFNGDLVNSYLDYKPLFPKIIRRVDTLKVYERSVTTLSNNKALIGVGAGYSHQFLSLLGSYTSKKKWQFIYEYGKPISNTRDIINGVPFEFKQDDLHSFKIIKHF